MSRPTCFVAVAVVLALTLQPASADPIPRPESGPIAPAAEREPTGADIAKAKASDPVKLVEEVEQEPLGILQKLDQQLRRSDADADQLQMAWTAIGGPEISLWLGKTGIVREAVTAMKRTLSAILLKSDQKEVPFPEWVKNHSRFLNEVASGTGVRMAVLKGTLNHEIETLEGMAECAKPIREELHSQLWKQHAALNGLSYQIPSAETMFSLDTQIEKLDRTKVAIRNLKYVMKTRIAFAKAFLEVHESAVDEHTGAIAAYRTVFQNPEVVKGVNASWKKYVDDWLVLLEESLDDCEIALALVHKEWEPFLSGDFYQDLRLFKGLKLDDLTAPVEKLSRVADEQVKIVESSTKLSAEVSAKLKNVLELTEEQKKRYDSVKQNGIPWVKEIDEMLEKVEASRVPDVQVLRELRQIRNNFDPPGFFAVLQRLLDHREGIIESLQGIYDRIEDALGDKAKLAALQAEYAAGRATYKPKDARLCKDVDNWIYDLKVACEKAKKLFKDWEKRQ